MRQLETSAGLSAIRLPPDDPAELFVPVENYALQPLPQAFENIKAALSLLFQLHSGIEEFDATAFYSRRRPNLTPDAEAELADFNQAAFGAAKRMGGLVVYYQGQLLLTSEEETTNPALNVGFTPDCLSFCVWESRRQALAGADVAAHRKAANKVSQWYINFAVQKFTITTGVRGKDNLVEEANIQFGEY